MKQERLNKKLNGDLLKMLKPPRRGSKTKTASMKGIASIVKQLSFVEPLTVERLPDEPEANLLIEFYDLVLPEVTKLNARFEALSERYGFFCQVAKEEGDKHTGNDYLLVITVPALRTNIIFCATSRCGKTDILSVVDPNWEVVPSEIEKMSGLFGNAQECAEKLPFMVSDIFDLYRMTDYGTLPVLPEIYEREPDFDWTRFDGVEVHPVKRVGKNEFEICESTDQGIVMWSVYLHLVAKPESGGIQCIADFGDRFEALSFAQGLCWANGWELPQ